MRSVDVLLLGISLCLSGQAQRADVFSMRAQPGPYVVGLRVVDQYDRSRNFVPKVDDLGRPTTGEKSRPIQTLVWYPAVSTKREHVSVADYLALRTTETSFGSPTSPAGLDEWFIEGIPDPSALETWAIRDATPVAHSFPIVVYAPSFSPYSWENLDLCEYLASFGYIVVAGPGMGVQRESTHDIAGASAQAQDISFLIGWAEGLPDADETAVAVVGFSWGGLSNVFAAARDNRIGALVALDGSMRYFPGVIQQAGDVHPELMTVPLLFLKGRDSLEDQAQLEANFKNAAGPNALNAWTHGDLVSVEMLDLLHPEFNSLSQRSEHYWELDFAHRSQTDIDRADGATGYAWVARYTREFLDAYLKHDPSAVAFLRKSPDENEVPKHILNATFRKALPLPFDFADFREQVGEQGFDHISDVYTSARSKHPAFSLESDAVTAWGYRLFGEHHAAEAIAVMRLAVQIKPSSNSYSALGEVYARTGQKANAVETYKKALAIDPGNIIAKELLAAVEK